MNRLLRQRARAVALIALTFVLFCAASAPSHAARTGQGLIVLYPFTEGSGTSVADQSGNGSPMNLSFFGNVGWRTSGNGIVLDGGRVGTSGAAAKLNSALRAAGTSTFEVWARPANVTQGGPARLVVVSPDATKRNFHLGQDATQLNAKQRVQTATDSITPVLKTANGAVSIATLHIVHTYDGQRLSLYVNGVQRPESTAAVGNYSGWNLAYLFSIGSEPTSDAPFRGEIYLVAAYDRALSPAEVATNFQAGPAVVTDPPVQVVTPDVIVLMQAIAESSITSAGLEVGTITMQPSASMPAGHVISQSPSALSSIPAGSSVDLVISTGVNSIAVPDLTGLAQSAAESELSARGLHSGTISTQPHASIPAGIVIAHTPAAGALVAPGSGVDLIVSSAPVTTMQLRFSDDTARLGLPNRLSWGATWADIDGDTWPDIFVNSHTDFPYLLRSNQGQSFTNVTAASGVNVRLDEHSCKWADYDRDADLDVYCTTGADKGNGAVPAAFWQNNGSGFFINVATASGTGFAEGRGRTVTWIDFDKDGDQDLFVGTEVGTQSNPRARIFRNDGATFTDVTASSGVSLEGELRLSLAFDYEQDGDQDLMTYFAPLGNASFPCRFCVVIFRNDGTGTFAPISGESLGIQATSLRAMSLGDYDNDGDLDLFTATGNANSGPRLHKNIGNGRFAQVSASGVGLGPAAARPVEDAIWADFDNDGFLDLYLTRSDADGHSNAPNVLFLNQRNGTFRDETALAHAAGTTVGRGDTAAVADFDQNGFQDLLLANGSKKSPGPFQLLRNEGTANHWTRIIPLTANGSIALGTKVWVTSNGVTQYREFFDNNSAPTSHELVVHFGTGQAGTVDLLRVQWHDGTSTTLQGVTTNQVIVVQKQ